MVKDARPIVIITARTGSTRLPGKVLRPFWKGMSLLEFLIRRLQTKAETSRLALAIPDTPGNEALAETAQRCGIGVCRGPEEDVLGRMGLCLGGAPAEFVARVTADNPFTDPGLFALQWEEMKRRGDDYSYCRNCPRGTAADIWTAACFRESLDLAASPYEREHANAWVWNHPERYRILWFDPPFPMPGPDLNLSIDREEEFQAVQSRAALLPDALGATLAELAGEGR